MPASLCCLVHVCQYTDSTQLGRQRGAVHKEPLFEHACMHRDSSGPFRCNSSLKWKEDSAFAAVVFGVLHGLAPPCASSRLWRFIAMQRSSRRQKHLVCSHVVHWAVSASFNDGKKHLALAFGLRTVASFRSQREDEATLKVSAVAQVLVARAGG